jgi:hypothetical protein
MAAARDHEQVHPIADIPVGAGSCCADLLQMLDRPGRGIERIRPALVHEQFASAVRERAEIRINSVYERARVGV